MPARILIVEDDSSQAEGLSSVLASRGYKTFTASDGVDGLIRAREMRPEVVITGIDMPRLDGFELIERLRFEKLPSKIVVVSAFDQPSSVVKAVKLGADEFLPKPLNFEELLSVLQRLVPDGHSESLDVRVGMTVDEVERRLVLATLEATQHNKTRAAEVLGISLKTLHNKLNEYKTSGFIN